MTKRRIKMAVIAGVALVLLFVGSTTGAVANTGQAKNQNKKMSDIWLDEPEYSIIEGEVDKSAFVLHNENLTFTKNQKEQLYDVISSWYTDKFEEAKGLELENFADILTSTFDTKLVWCDGEDMILVTFTTPEMENRIDLFKGDTIQTLICNNNNEYEIYKVWYKGKYKYTRVNQMSNNI